MELLFKREQSTSTFGRVSFKLWAKTELNEDEKALLKRYRFADAVLIYADQPKLFRNAVLAGLAVLILANIAFWQIFPNAVFGSFALIAGVGSSYWYYHSKRETIYVRDLLHGRHFSCSTVIELARKEAWLTTIVSFLRQVMESAKHWDGTEHYTIEPLPKEEARQIILKGV